MAVPFSYDTKRVIVTGAASGMGRATVAMLDRLGAEVHALDIATCKGPATQSHETDCGDPASIDATLASIGSPVHCLFNVAGVPQTHPPERVLGVNFLGLRHLTEAVLDQMMGEGVRSPTSRRRRDPGGRPICRRSRSCSRLPTSPPVRRGHRPTSPSRAIRTSSRRSASSSTRCSARTT